MDAITNGLARQMVARHAVDAERARVVADARRAKRTTRHGLATSLRRFADKLDS